MDNKFIDGFIIGFIAVFSLGCLMFIAKQIEENKELKVKVESERSDAAFYYERYQNCIDRRRNERN